jgi:hypothetical protein
MHDIAEVNVNAKSHVGANGNGGNGNGTIIHLSRNSHLTACGLDRSFFSGAIVADKIGPVTCRNCQRVHATINLVRRRARKLERLHPAAIPRPVNGERPGLVQVRWAFEQAEQNA